MPALDGESYEVEVPVFGQDVSMAAIVRAGVVAPPGDAPGVVAQVPIEAPLGVVPIDIVQGVGRSVPLVAPSRERGARMEARQIRLDELALESAAEAAFLSSYSSAGAGAGAGAGSGVGVPRLRIYRGAVGEVFSNSLTCMII